MKKLICTFEPIYERDDCHYYKYVISFLRKESCPSTHHSRRGGEQRFKHVASSSSSKEQVFIVVTVS